LEERIGPAEARFFLLCFERPALAAPMGWENGILGLRHFAALVAI
jgi:hypothetical protein